MMHKNWLFLIGFLVAILTSHAQDSDISRVTSKKEYRLEKFEVLNPLNRASDILRSENNQEKSAFLSNLNLKMKGSFISAEWKLDSILTTGFNDQNQQFESNYRQLFSTMQQNRKFEVRNYRMDEEKGHWIIDEAQYYHFDEAGFLDSVEFQTRVTLNYILYTRLLYGYENGRLQSEIKLEKFDEFDDWERLTRLEYEYNNDGLLSTVYFQEPDQFNSNFWSTLSFVEYAYDSLNLLERETYFDYDDYEMISTKTSELLYEYDSQNRLTQIVEYVESWQSGVFVPEALQEYSYDENGKVYRVTNSRWDYDTEEWIGFNRTTQAFDPDEHTLLIQEKENWDAGWILSERTIYETNSFLEESKIESAEFFSTFLPVYVQNGIVSDQITQLVNDGINWQENEVTSFHFSPIAPVGISETDQTGIQFYPNPASEFLIVKSGKSEVADLIVRDLAGRILIQKNLNREDQIDIRTLSSGIYLIELQEKGQRIFSDKIIKK